MSDLAIFWWIILLITLYQLARHWKFIWLTMNTWGYMWASMMNERIDHYTKRFYEEETNDKGELEEAPKNNP